MYGSGQAFLTKLLVSPFADTSHQTRSVSSRPYYSLPNSSHERRSVLAITEPPRFHSQAKGKNVRLDAHSRKATRRNSFCNGVTFTNRPIHLYEKVRLKLVAVHHGWSGALRFGFTIHDPSQMSSDEIPKYACPDLVTRPGYWAKALPERFAVRDNILAFWVDRHGRVFYSINDEEPILFHCGIKVSGPLWALIDVYGITHEVQILGKCVFWPVACSSGCSFHKGMIVERRHMIYLVDHFNGTLKKTNLLLVLYFKLAIFLLPAVGIQKAMYFRNVSGGKS